MPAAVCHLGDDQAVGAFLDLPTPMIARLLSAAGVADHRIRLSSDRSRT
jgi:hypothetical protein